ncbi:MAG: PKD domain-containing protein, partial [Candidatus Thermoplasmatota archaeon]
MIDKKYYRFTVLFVTVILVSAGLTIAIKDTEAGLSEIDTEKTKSDEETKFVSRDLSSSEMRRMKAEIGVRESEKDYNEIINGHGTGYAPPSEEMYEKMTQNMKVVEDVNGSTNRILSDDELDLTESKYFPPIGNQGQQGSCAAWGIVYYSNTFLQAKAYDFDASTGNEDYLMSPAWAYNKVNGGEDSGSHIYSLSDVIDDLGCANLETMPYDASNVTAWGDEDAWRSAPKFRTGGFESTSSVDVVKTWLQEEHLVNLAIDANEYDGAFDPYEGDNVMSSEEYEENETNHVNTIAGYDDSISEDGETGAFKVANSWGSYWGPNDDGTYWMTYDCFEEIVGGYKSAYRLVDPYYDGEQEDPELLGTWEFSETGSRTASTEIGIGPSNSPVESRHPLASSDGGDYSYPDFIAADISEFADDWNQGDGETNFYLEMGQNSGETTISSFNVEYYDSSYEIGSPTFTSDDSPDVPSTIPTTVEVEFTGNEGSDGEIALDKDVYPAQDTVQIELYDSDLAGTDNHFVTIQSTTETSNQTVELYENDDSPGQFTGSIDISKADGGGDLIISHGDTITVYYEDEDSGNGESQVKTDSASVDAEAPQVVSTEPTDEEQNVPLTKDKITVDLSENIETSSVDGSTIDITPDVGHGLILEENSSKLDAPLYSDGNYQEGDYAASCYQGYVCVQSFEPQSSGEISSIKFNMFKLGDPPEDLKVQIIDNPPDGQPLVTKHVEPSEVGSGSDEASWVRLDLEDPIQVDSGVKYGLRFSMEDVGGEDNRYRLSLTDNNYDDGHLSQYDQENDEWNELNGYDTCFAYNMKDDDLQPDTDYQVTVAGDITDQVGNTMGEVHSFSFSTTDPGTEGPTASFDYTPANPSTGESVQFQDSSTPENEIASWSWDFGDGATSSEENPTHSYDEAGPYTVELTVTGDDGLTDTTTDQITVQDDGGGEGYCDVDGGDTSYEEYITNVQFNGINKDSGDDGGYADHT